MIPSRMTPLALGLCAVRGSDASVLTAGGEEPNSFGNVFFFANLATGLLLLLLDRGA
ncbi:MAG: hypothetical protein VKK63_01550 [Synechococcus sp.]|nr:hypothetical protein [Synechococcus sp.]